MQNSAVVLQKMQDLPNSTKKSKFGSCRRIQDLCIADQENKSFLKRPSFSFPQKFRPEVSQWRPDVFEQDEEVGGWPQAPVPTHSPRHPDARTHRVLHQLGRFGRRPSNLGAKWKEIDEKGESS